MNVNAQIEQIGDLTKALVVDYLHTVISQLDSSAMLDAPQAARYLGCSVRQLQRLDIPKVKFGESQNAKVRWRIADLDTFLNDKITRD